MDGIIVSDIAMEFIFFYADIERYWIYEGGTP